MPDVTPLAIDNAGQNHISFHPGEVSAEWVLKVTEGLLNSTQGGVKAAQEVLPCAVAQQILEALYDLLKQEPTVVDIVPATPDVPVVVVGDTHGQLHDVCSMLQKVGHPSEQQLYVFNGDFVDRGAWGLEVLVLLACWKLAHPKQVVILRGNHECTTCTHMYGFRTEVLAKYGPTHFKDVFKICKKVFAALPLAAVVGGQTLVLHGGLFRKPAASTHRRKKRRKTLPGNALGIGSLQDLRAAGKGGLDPNGAGKSVIATDVLWSDPAPQPGLVENEARGVGLLFGPDITQAFLAANQLRLIIRSHEGPDARWKRDGMQDMAKGHSLDHDTPEGKLMTVFSAPDYPQFQPKHEDRFNNLGAVAVLRGSQDNYASPEMVEYPAAPRPEAQAFYEYEDVPDSDEEMSIGHGSASDMSAGSSQAGSLASHASSADDPHAEVLSKAPGIEADSPTATVHAAISHHPDNVASAGGDDPGAAASVQNNSHEAAMHVDHTANALNLSSAPDQDRAAPVEAAAYDHESSRATGLQPPDDGPVHHGNGSLLHQADSSLPAAVPEAAEPHVTLDGSHKRTAATVFNQGIADEAEAADLNAGISVAADADDGEPAADSTRQVQVGNESTETDTAVERPTEGQLSSLSVKSTRKVQPRPAPRR